MQRFYRILLGCCIVAVCGGVLVVTSMNREDSLPRFPSFFMTPGFVEGAYTAAGVGDGGAGVRMVLVNHHLLAPRLIAQALLSGIASRPSVVILISPDHFSRGAAPISSVIAVWPTPFGDIRPARSEIERLASERVIHLEEWPFYNEHGITNITMFIARAFPDARLMPIIVKSTASDQSIQELAEKLSILEGSVLIVGSFDFTHDSTEEQALRNDALSLQILSRGDLERSRDITVDSNAGIRLMMSVARLQNLSFRLLERSSSAVVLRDTMRTDVTSYITGVWSK